MTNVLVVDDELLNRNLPLLMLAQVGVNCLTADSGKACLDAIKMHPDIDQVLLDISMPGLSGLDVCSMIRKDPSMNHLRIIAYTAHAFEHQREELKKSGFDDVLTKPFQSAELYAVLNLPPRLPAHKD